MSYAVVRMAKMKSHDLKGMQFHNQRERESKTNPDIDKSKFHLNYDLHNSTNIDYNKTVKNIIESQKDSPRKIRKDAVLVNELLVTSDKAFFDRLDPAEQKRFFAESYKLFSERYGKENIAYAAVHNDEKTPHLHLGVVPMREGKLQGKNVFNRQELQWMQEEFPKHMQSLGFEVERGERSDREHIEMKRFKAITLQNDIETLQEEHKTLHKDVEGLVKAVQGAKEVDSLQVVKGGLFDSKSVKMPVEDFETIKALAKASEGLKKQIMSVKVDAGFVNLQNQDLKAENDKLKAENIELQTKNQELETENENLKHDMSLLKLQMAHLKQTLEIIKKSAQKYLGIGKEKMLEFVGESRLHDLTKKLGKNESFRPEIIKRYIPEDELEGAKKYIQKINKKEMEKVQQEKEEAGKKQSRKEPDLER